MLKDKNFNPEQVAAPNHGTANTQDAAKNAPVCSGHTSKSENFTSFKLSLELRAMIIKAVLLIMEKYNYYSKGMNKELTQEAFEHYLDQTPYRKLKADKNAPCSLILRAATSCLYLCVKVKRDEMHSVFFGRNILEHEHVFEAASDEKDFRVDFSEAISGFTKKHYEYLKELYPKAKDGAELAKLAFSDVLMFAARFTGRFDTHLSTAGSKKWAMRLMHLDLLSFIEGQKKLLVDVFSRTASVALASMDIFDEISCGDKDKRFVNFFEVLRNCTAALILRIRSEIWKFKENVLNRDVPQEDKMQLGKEFYEDIKARLNSNLNKTNYRTKIDVAVCLLIWTRFSYCGFGKDFNLEQASKFVNRIDTVCNDLLYTSMVLTDRENSRNIHKFIYKRTAGGLAYRLVSEPSANTVSICPITYEYWDFMKPISDSKDDVNKVYILDPPYPRQFFLICGDYKNKFGSKEFVNMLKSLENRDCKAILFCSENIDVEATAKRYGFRLVGTYNKGENSTEVTDVFAYKISPDEKLFDPKSHGELY